jgi:Chromosome segregation ATPases
VKSSLGSLKRQAAKARRYSEIRDQMRGIVRQMLAGKAREHETEAERIATQLAEFTAAETQHAQAIQQQEGEQDRLSQRNYELDTEIRQNQNQLNLTRWKWTAQKIKLHSTRSVPMNLLAAKGKSARTSTN